MLELGPDFVLPWLVSVLQELSLSLTHAFRTKFKIKNANIVKRMKTEMKKI